MFITVAARVRGRLHRQDHSPCQDAATAFSVPSDGDQIVFGVLADGGGSRHMSHVGSRLTVRTAGLLMRAVWSPRTFIPASEERLKCFWEDLVSDCQAVLADEAGARGVLTAEGEPDTQPYACTFLAFMATRQRLSAAQIGDGLIICGSGGPDRFTLLFENREHAEAGQVVWLTEPHWASDFRCTVLDGPIDLVVASSDGMKNAVLSWEDRPGAPKRPHEPYFTKLRDTMLETWSGAHAPGISPEQVMQERLIQGLSLPALNPYTNDDKSMAVAIWHDGAGLA